MNLSPDFICLSCWVTKEEDCADHRSTKANRAICPKRRLAKANLPPAQMKQLESINRIRKYPLKDFIRMVEIQAERNALVNASYTQTNPSRA
jgi:hypothetical protein